MPKYTATIAYESGRREITFEAANLAQAKAAAANWVIDRPWARLVSVEQSAD